MPERLWVFGHTVDAIDMTFSQLRYEWSGKHTLELCCIEGPGVFSRSLKRVQRWVEVSGLSSNI